MALEKAAKKCGIRGQVWWAAAGEKKAGRSREVNAVQEEGVACHTGNNEGNGGDAGDSRSAGSSAGRGGVNAVETEKPQTEVEKLRAENERLKAAQGEGTTVATTAVGSSDTGPKGKRAKERKGRAQRRGALPAVGPTTRTSALSGRARGTGVAKAAAMEAAMARDMVRVEAATAARAAMVATVVMVAMGASRGSSSSSSSPPSTRTTRTRLSCR